MSQFVTVQGKCVQRSNNFAKCELKVDLKKKLFFLFSLFFNISVGQCGNQIGSAFWPLTLHEYGIQTTTGGVNLLKVQRDHVKHIDDLSDAFSSFFHVPNDKCRTHFQDVADLNMAKVKARVCTSPFNFPSTQQASM